jgi:hypothetical protein
MSSYGANTQQIDGILKDYYEDFVAEQVNQKNPLKDLFTFQKLDFAGREIVYTGHVSRNVSPMFVGEDSAFADAGAQGHVQVRVGQRKLMGRIRITYEAMADSMSSKGAFKQARKDEMDGLIKDLARREEYALCSDGRGVLALVDEADPTTDATLELDAPGGITNDNFGNRFIQPGMWLAAVNPATGQIRTGIRKVLSCNADGSDVTLDAAAAGWSQNDFIVQAANSAVTDVLDTSYEHAFWGMMALVDDGTYRNNYFGVDRSVYGNYSSYVKAGTGALSVEIMQQTADVLDQKLGGRIDMILTHHSTRREYLLLTDDDRRYATAAALMNPDAGTKAFKLGDVTIGEVEIKVIRDFPLDVMMFLDKANSGFICYQGEPGKWVDEDGSILVRVGSGSSGRDAFEGWYRQRKQYHCRYPGYNGRHDGISGQALVVVRAE